MQNTAEHRKHQEPQLREASLEEIDDGIWNVYFGPLKLGRLLERHMRIEDAYGRLRRRTV